MFNLEKKNVDQIWENAIHFINANNKWFKDEVLMFIENALLIFVFPV